MSDHENDCDADLCQLLVHQQAVETIQYILDKYAGAAWKLTEIQKVVDSLR